MPTRGSPGSSSESRRSVSSSVGTVRTRLRAVVVGAVAAATLSAGCSQDPYTAGDGRAALIEVGYSKAEADCVIDGLDAYFREEFLVLQASEGIEEGVVPKRQADIFVKNRFAGSLDVPADLTEEANRLIRTCRA